MAYDEDLANRIRELIAAEPDVSEKKMFGGLAFLVGGHMSVAASGRIATLGCGRDFTQRCNIVPGSITAAGLRPAHAAAKRGAEHHWPTR